MTQHEPEPRQEPSWYPPLTVSYVGIAVLAAVAVVQGLGTLNRVVGATWEALWPYLLLLTALGALGGLVRSKLTRRYLLEVITTLLLLGFLASYTVVLLLADILDGGELRRLTTAILPVLLAVFPFARLLHIARRR